MIDYCQVISSFLLSIPKNKKEKASGCYRKTESCRQTNTTWLIFRLSLFGMMSSPEEEIRLDTIQMNREWKDTWSLLLSSVSLRVCYFLSWDWANCFTLEHNRRPMDVCFAFISPQMASVLIIVSGLTIIYIHLA